MRKEDCQRRLYAIVKGKKSGWFQQALCLRAMLFTGHAWMQPGKQSHHDHQHCDSMDQTEDRATPPSCHAQLLKEQHIDQGESPACEQMDDKAVEFCPVTIKRKDSSQHVRQIHSRQAKAL